MEKKKLIEVKNIDVAYGEAQVVWDVSMFVREGDIVALIGANGAGKSSILKTICGLNRLQEGDIEYDGQPLNIHKPEQAVERAISYVPEGRRLFAQLTVHENLVLGAFPKRVRKDTAQSLAEVYELFPRLKEREKQLAGSLSGGEQQMVAIGRAMMARPRLLMLDEPSLGLAPNIVRQMFDIIKELNRRGVTILLVEQNVPQTMKISQYAYVLQNGRITMQGFPQNLLNDTGFQKAYLGMMG